MKLKQPPLISEILPGSFALGLLAIAFWESVESFFNPSQTNSLLFRAGSFILITWILGTFFDAIRNGFLEERILDRWMGKMDWNFFFEGEKEKVGQFENYYYAYYTMGINFVIAAVFFFIVMLLIHWCWSVPCSMRDIWTVAGAILFAVVFWCDACTLRRHMVKLLEQRLQNNNHGS